jgi:hypothetical protein
VTTAAPNISARIHSLNRPNLVSIGTIVWLSSELMFFAGLFAIYFTARAQNPPGNTWPPAPTHLDVPYALVVTIVLVGSSFTCQFGVFAAREDVEPETHVARVLAFEQLVECKTAARFLDGQLRSIQCPPAKVREEVDSVVPEQEHGDDGPCDHHDQGEQGILPLPSNITDWNGPAAPAWDQPMPPQLNFFHYALYLGETKNKVMGHHDPWKIYPDLFLQPGIKGNIVRQAKLTAGVIHGYFYSGSYSGARPTHEELIAAYQRDEALPDMLAGSTFKKMFALPGRQTNIE